MFSHALQWRSNWLKFAIKIRKCSRVRFKLEVIIIIAMLQHVIKSKHEAEIADDAVGAHPDGAFKAAKAKAFSEKRYHQQNRSKLSRIQSVHRWTR